MARLTRRAALIGLGAGGLLGLGYVLRGVFDAPTPATEVGSAREGGMMGGTTRADMSAYMEMFSRHREISRVVEEIPGGVRTTTESRSPDLVARLQAHVSSMHAHLDQGAEVACMSQSLPTLFRRAGSYRRQLTFTPTGVIADETAEDPDLTLAIRAHAREVTGFVREGMPAMMNQMMTPR
jgi:hypothetical protein